MLTLRFVMAALVAAFLCPLEGFTAEAGYSLIHQRARANTAEAARGFEGRLNFGGGQSERYSGDRWSLAIGYVNPRATDTDHLVDTPEGCCGYADDVDSYSYASFSHRWYTRAARFKAAPELRFFVGTGVSWRDAETCVLMARKRHRVQCWDGTVDVSSRWAFHQTAGLKWRERLELAYEHDSTGGVSAVNRGDDRLRLSLFVLIGQH